MTEESKSTLKELLIEKLDELLHDERLSQVDQVFVETIQLAILARDMGITIWEWEAQVAAEDEAAARERAKEADVRMEEALKQSAKTTRMVTAQTARQAQRAAAVSRRSSSTKRSKLKRAA